MIGFKTTRIRDEFSELITKNKALFELLVDLAQHIHDVYKKDVVLTSIYRDDAEQADLYKSAVKKVLKSAHATYEAVDLRSWLYTDAEIQAIVAYLNAKYKNKNGKLVALFHTVPGNAAHFHVALYRE